MAALIVHRRGPQKTSAVPAGSTPPVGKVWARRRLAVGAESRCGSLEDNLDKIADLQLLIGIEAVQYLESFNLTVEKSHPCRK